MGRATWNDISPTFHGHHPFPTGASYQFTSALLYKTADKTTNKESLSNHHGVEIYCDIGGSEEYTPFAKLPYVVWPWFGIWFGRLDVWIISGTQAIIQILDVVESVIILYIIVPESNIMLEWSRNVSLACVASVSARVSRESWDEGKKKKEWRAIIFAQ